MTWYNNSVKYNIPLFVDEIKKSITERLSLISHKNNLITRLQSAESFFSQTLSQGDVLKGIQQLREINKEISNVDKCIQEIDTKIAMILESKLSDVSFKLKSPAKINVLGEDSPPKEIYFVPWNTIDGEDRIEITPEDVWMFKMVKNVFSVTEKNIEFLNVDKEKELYNRE